MDSPPTSTVHVSTGDLGLGQEGQHYGAEANTGGVAAYAASHESRGELGRATSTPTHRLATDKGAYGSTAAPRTLGDSGRSAFAIGLKAYRNDAFPYQSARPD